ncbi:hypothetical protein IE077_003020 [Cardiosporidium cionae]|uniref:General transcription factor 3C polypeptide 5 n=1 Tax=Cardiosporidium cionae TaxID=476202 RepID=A0ABQ7J990_9APIC|nr:hypothetical protein IE077_003020 [Cardiosporidium cionae]|eukprot:KAF8820581.1 hypothetical protein IE077_003020 [Cardiosporidium cionae]
MASPSIERAPIDVRHRLTIPRKIYSIVELPGRLAGEFAASSIVQCLGGSATLAASFQNPKQSPLIYRFDPNDKYSKFLAATHCSVHGLIMKRIQRQSGKIEFEIKGIYVQKFVFESMADFFYAPPEHARMERSIDDEIQDPSSGPIFLPPPMFTRVSTPFPYKYEENPFGRTAKYFKKVVGDVHTGIASTPFSGSATEGSTFLPSISPLLSSPSEIAAEVSPSKSEELAATGRQDFLKKPPEEALNIVWKFSEGNIPQVPLPNSKLVELMHHLFNQRPLWLRQSIDEYLPSNFTAWKRKSAFARICFGISDGPWRGCLCRFGYDPRNSSFSSYYQTLDFRDPHFRSINWKTLQERSSSPTMEFFSNREEDISSKKWLESSRSPVEMTKEASFFSSLMDSTVEEINKKNNSNGKNFEFLEGVKVLSLPNEGGSQKQEKGNNSPPSFSSSFPVLTPNDEIHFRVPPLRHSQLYQLCDIEDSSIQKLLMDASLLSLCSRDTGWYTKDILVKIRDILSVKCKRMREVSLQ